MTITPDILLYLLIGFAIGFVLEFLIDLLFWRPRTRRLAANSEALQDQLAKNEQRLQNTQNELKTTAEQTVHLKSRLTKWEAQARYWEAQLAEAKATLTQAEITISDLESKMHVPEKVWDSLNGRIAELKAALTRKTAAQEQTQQAWQQLKNERDQLQARLKAAAGETELQLRDLNKQLFDTYQKHNQVQLTLQQTQEELGELQSQSHVPGEVWDALNSKIRSLQDKLETAHQKASQLEIRLIDLQGQHQAAVNQNGNLERRLQTAQTQILELTSQLDSLKNLSTSELKKMIEG